MGEFSLRRTALAVLAVVLAAGVAYGVSAAVKALRPKPNRRREVLEDCRNVDKQPGPVYTFGHDNVTYYCWRIEIEKGRMPPSGTAVVHLDAHDDIFGQSVDSPLSLPKPRNERERLAYEVAGGTDIGNWLLRASNEGIVGEIYWVVPRWERADFRGLHHTRKLLRRIERGKETEGPRLKRLTLEQLSQTPVPKNAALHVDLDWFSCLLRTDMTSHVASAEEIAADAEALGTVLEKIGLKPVNITIANSPAYVPRDQWQMIQDELLASLRRHGIIEGRG